MRRFNPIRPDNVKEHPFHASPRFLVISVICMMSLSPRALKSQAAPSGTAMETISINAQGTSHPFPHYWERMFGSGRAILSLRASYRQDLRSVKAATDFEYI